MQSKLRTFNFVLPLQIKQAKCSGWGTAAVLISLSEEEGEVCVLSTAVSRETNDQPGLSFAAPPPPPGKVLEGAGGVGGGGGLSCGLRRDE